MKHCILIYDDDSEILVVCKIILEQHHYNVKTRILCDNVIEDIREVKPHVILMDLWIPTIGGEQAISLVKKNRKTNHLPVILFSANSEVNVIANRTNANGFLKKPFEINSLINVIESSIPK
jgi:DNA-binding NtrC family response regulator